MATHTIAVAGKGGVGKTTTCGMIIDYLCKQKKGPILVVDADANSNLNEVLGVEVDTTLGDIREDMARAEQKGTVPSNMTKADYAEMMFGNALIEEDDFDMLVMGRTQGKGCYCFVNGVLKTQIDKYVGNYRYMVVDNEAGLEHISRGTLPHVDTMLLISDCSRRGIQAVGRIAEMIREMDLKPGEMKLIVNRAPGGELNPGVAEEIKKYGLDLVGVLPQEFLTVDLLLSALVLPIIDLAWSEAYAQLPMRTVISRTAGSLALAVAVLALVQVLPPAWSFASMKLLPLGSILLIAVLRQSPSIPTYEALSWNERCSRRGNCSPACSSPWPQAPFCQDRQKRAASSHGGPSSAAMRWRPRSSSCCWHRSDRATSRRRSSHSWRSWPSATRCRDC